LRGNIMPLNNDAGRCGKHNIPALLPPCRISAAAALRSLRSAFLFVCCFSSS
jgi:hypothetical protein